MYLNKSDFKLYEAGSKCSNLLVFVIFYRKYFLDQEFLIKLLARTNLTTEPKGIIGSDGKSLE